MSSFLLLDCLDRWRLLYLLMFSACARLNVMFQDLQCGTSLQALFPKAWCNRSRLATTLTCCCCTAAPSGLIFVREVLEHFNLEIPEGREPTEEEEEIRQVNH